MVGSLSAGLLLADEAGAHLPSVDDFLPPEILFQGTPFAINRIILIRIVATIVLLVVLGVTAKRAKLIPGRWQGVVEYGLDFVRDKVVYDVMGEARGKRYVPMITTLFFTIFIFNLCGIIPGMNMAARNSTFFINLESEGRPLLCEPRLSDEGGVRIRLWLRDPAGTGTGGAIALLSRDEAAVLANAIDTRRNWVGEKADDALPRIGVSATVDSTMIRFMECRGEGHIALTVTEAGRLASWLHDMADGRWRDHNGYVPEVVK